MTTCLILTTYERPELLKKCLDSLDLLTEKPNYIVYVDDASEDFFINGFLSLQSVYATVIKKHTRKGIKDSLLQGFDAGFKLADICINLDPDSICKPNLMTRLKDLKTRFPDRIISGFNCNHPKNPVLFDGGDYVERKMCNGINMCLSREDYENIVRPALLSPNNWDSNCTNNKNFIITKPSVVDHLGWNQSSMNHQNGDRSCDF